MGFEPMTYGLKDRYSTTELCVHNGWETGTRTPIYGIKIRSPTIRRSPNIIVKVSLL